MNNSKPYRFDFIAHLSTKTIDERSDESEKAAIDNRHHLEAEIGIIVAVSAASEVK